MGINFAVQPNLCRDYVDSTRGVVRCVDYLTDKEQPQGSIQSEDGRPHNCGPRRPALQEDEGENIHQFTPTELLTLGLSDPEDILTKTEPHAPEDTIPKTRTVI